MTKANDPIKRAIIESALPSVPFDGWTTRTLEEAALAAGYSKDMVRSVFPRGVQDALSFLSRWADERMLERLGSMQKSQMRVRDKVTAAVRARLEILGPHKEAERLAIAFWLRPMRKWEGVRLVWKTADVIWDWAGDTATDYNRYTKRGLLAGVLSATTLFWLNDTSAGHKDSWEFLDRRINDVLSIGKIVGRLKTA